MGDKAGQSVLDAVTDLLPVLSERAQEAEDSRQVPVDSIKGLTEAGHAVDVAETGTAGEVLAGENPYDLIILDVMLPDQNGLDTARHLRRDGYGGAILMLTALAERLAAEKAGDAKAARIARAGVMGLITGRIA